MKPTIKKSKNKPPAKWRLDRASLVGAPLALGVVLVAQVIGGGQLKSLVQPEAAVVVFGGTVAALLISYPWATLRTALAATAGAFATAPLSRSRLVQQFTDYSLRVRRNGVLVLEPEIAATADPFMARALTLMVDGFAAPRSSTPSKSTAARGKTRTKRVRRSSRRRPVTPRRWASWAPCWV